MNFTIGDRVRLTGGTYEHIPLGAEGTAVAKYVDGKVEKCGAVWDKGFAGLPSLYYVDCADMVSLGKQATREQILAAIDQCEHEDLMDLLRHLVQNHWPVVSEGDDTP